MIRTLVVVLVFAAAVPAEEPTPAGFPLPAGALRRFGNRQLRHPNGITTVTVSPDGKLLATGGSDGVVVWDLKTLTPRRSFPDLRLGFNSVTTRGGGLAFLPDSRSLLVGVRPNDDGPIRIDQQMELAQVWDVESGKVKFGLPGQYDYYATCWPVGGKELALLSSTGDGTAVRYFDAKDGKPGTTVRLPLNGNPPWVGPGGNLVVVQAQGQGNGTVVDVRDGKEVLSLPSPAVQVALSRDGKLLVWVDPLGTVHVHDLATKKEKFTFAHPEKTKPGPMLVSADNQTLYFTSSHGRLFRWDLVNNKKGPDFGNRHNFWSLTAIALSPDESVLYSVSYDHLVKRWDTKTGQELPLPEGYTTHTSIVVAADGKHLILTDHEGQVDYWELATGKMVKQLQKSHLGGINHLVESADGKWLAGGRTGQDVRLFDLTTGKVVRDIPLGDNSDAKWGDQVQRVAFAPGAAAMYSTSEKTGLTAWEVPGGKKLWNTPGTGSVLAVDPKGRWLALGGGFNREQVQWGLFDAKTGANVARTDVEQIEVTVGQARYRYPPYVSDLAWLPDGSRVLSAHYDGTVRVWDPETRKEVGRWTGGKPGATSCLTVSADGRWVAVGGSDRSVSVWEVATGKKVLGFAGHDSGVIQVAFTRDGRGLVSNADLSPILWDLCPKDLPRDGFWEQLADADAAKAYRAQWALVKDPAAAVKLFDEKVKPAELSVKREQFDKWVTDLDSPQFRAREAAEKGLTAAGGKVPVGWLRRALADAKADEPRARLGRVLAKRERDPDPTWWRLSRAVQVLELAGTEEAKSLLKTWAAAEGSPLAEEALGRLTK